MAGLSEQEEFELLSLERERAFQSTPGGAAVGNPNISRQGDKGIRGLANFEPLADIGGAAVAGGALGAFSKEILTGAGNVLQSFPHPAARTVGGFLRGAGQTIGAGGRTFPAIAGAISGGAGETAGQVVDMTTAGKENPVIGEVARFVGAGVTPEVVTLAMAGLRKYVQTPALSLMSKLKKETALSILEKFDKNPGSLTERESKFLNEEIAALRGGEKSNQSLEDVGTLMGEHGKSLLDAADQKLIAAQQAAAGVKPTGAQAELADIGGNLRASIVKRNEAALAERSKQYKATEEQRDALVSQSEVSGRFVNDLPEYKSIIDSIRLQLDNTTAMKRSPDVQRSLQKILSELQNPEQTAPGKKMVLSGQNLDLQDVPGEPKPVSFQAIDDVRRKLGEVFKGKPSEGYEALNDARGKALYARLSDLQKKFAGGDTGPQAKLLDDYHSQSEALGQFKTKIAKKATALDSYQEGEFATDASTLPGAYFKTRASVQALKELTGNQAQVNHAALEYANKQLAGKDAEGVRKWLSANSEWLAETGPTRTIIDRYAAKLEGAERSLRNAEDFAAQAARDNKMLVGKTLPAQRAVDLIKSGDTELWDRAIPAIVQSKQAKQQMVSAVKQVLADQATAKGTSDLFSRNIRPFLEKAQISNRDEMNFIAQKLTNIQEMKIPESEKLGMARRVLLQAAGGWTATAGARAGVNTYQWTKEKMVPD